MKGWRGERREGMEEKGLKGKRGEREEEANGRERSVRVECRGEERGGKKEGDHSRGVTVVCVLKGEGARELDKEKERDAEIKNKREDLMINEAKEMRWTLVIEEITS